MDRGEKTINAMFLACKNVTHTDMHAAFDV